MHKIIVTGALGHIGSALIRFLPKFFFWGRIAHKNLCVEFLKDRKSFGRYEDPYSKENYLHISNLVFKDEN